MQYRNNKTCRAKLNRQVEQSQHDSREYGVKPLRFKSYYGQLSALSCYDGLDRNYTRSWKAHRKTQYKNK